MYTAIPQNTSAVLGEIVYSKDGYDVSSSFGRFYLYKKGYRLAELVSGQSTLYKKYKGDFDKWISTIKEKDTQKINDILEQIAILQADIVLISAIHELT